MFRNFLLVSLRNFLRNKAQTFINVFGLTLGLASATLIFLFVYDELTYDFVHPESDRIYAVGMTMVDKNGNRESYGISPGGWAAFLKQKFPDIEATTRVSLLGFPATIHNKEADRIVLNQDGELYWGENDIGEILDLSMINGTSAQALTLINSMIISQSAAKTLFGDQDPVNKTLSIKHSYGTFGKEVDYVVTGIFSDVISNSFFKPKYILNINGLRSVYGATGQDFDRQINGLNVTSNFFSMYFRLRKGASTEAINAELARMTDVTMKSDSGFYASGRRLTPLLAPLRELHFDKSTNWHFVDDSMNKKTLYILAGIAILILVIAAINYMNLATARSMRRAREVGVRKTLGSKRSEIALQFISESALTTFLALFFSFIVMMLLLPAFNELTGKTFSISSLLQPVVLLLILCLTLFVTILGGSYPAFYLSGFRPTEVLKGVTGGTQGDRLRKVLVTFQFAVAILLSVATYTIVRQMQLIQTSKLNEAGDQILSVRWGTVAPNEKYPALKNALNRDKDLDKVTMGIHLPRHDYFGNSAYNYRVRQIDDKEYNWSQLSADFDFPKTFGLEIIAGRDFDSTIPSDSNSVIINERAAVDLHKGITEMIGVQIENVDTKKTGTVIGIVRDFPFQSAYHAIGPLVLSPRLEDMDRILYIRLPAGRISEKIKVIEGIWKNVLPGAGFDYWFVSDEFNRLYKSERKITALAKIFAALAMAITILGLYGLASYMAEQRTKEIGIRKTMGASVASIIGLFLSVFLKIFLAACVLALPVAWYFTDNWLKTFTYRIQLTPMIFVLSTFGVLLLMIATVLYETVKAATANPVKALKHE